MNIIGRYQGINGINNIITDTNECMQHLLRSRLLSPEYEVEAGATAKIIVLEL